MSELRGGLGQIRRFPTVFADLGDPRMPGLRRLLMPKSRYYIYWTTHEEVVEILAVWHTSRGQSPLDEEP
jgi:plasmid stabilization system protein ParE